MWTHPTVDIGVSVMGLKHGAELHRERYNCEPRLLFVNRDDYTLALSVVIEAGLAVEVFPMLDFPRGGWLLCSRNGGVLSGY